MVELQKLQQVLWVVNIAAGVLLLILVAGRRNYRSFPAFTFYLLTNSTLSVLVFISYHRWGFTSPVFWWFASGMQILATSARALAVAELCKHLLARYPGIWGLAWRVMLVCAASTLVYSSIASNYQWKLTLVRANRGLELAIAAVIVAAFVIARYYRLEAKPADRAMAVGFCLYSCFRALNNTILERFLDNYVVLWNFLGMLAFLASLLLWAWALRKSQAEAAPAETLLPAGVYQAVAPQINLRLHLLNEQLGQFWKTEATRN
jgi:magnesium-transporting ATPase (P-type)